MEEKKNILTNNEVKDEELDTVSGGASRPRQQQTKKCAMDGCTKQIPADKSPGYCDACLEKMRNLGVHPFI